MVSYTTHDTVIGESNQSTVISRLIEQGINGNLDCLSVKPVILSPKECSLSYAPALEKLPLGVDLLDTVLFTIPKNQIEFVAWQIPIVISTELPTGRVLASAAHSAALFCCQAQAHGLVPMIDLRLTVLGNNMAKSQNPQISHPNAPRHEESRGYFSTSGPHYVSGDIKPARLPRRWRDTSPSYFQIKTSSPNLMASAKDAEEIAICRSLAEEMSAITARIVTSMTEMSVDFKNLVIGVGVDIETGGDLERTGCVESLLVSNLAKNPRLSDLGALCLILPPCQASNQKTLVDEARTVSPYPILFAQLRESMYSSAKLGRASSYHHLAPERIVYSSEADSLLSAGC